MASQIQSANTGNDQLFSSDDEDESAESNVSRDARPAPKGHSAFTRDQRAITEEEEEDWADVSSASSSCSPSRFVVGVVLIGAHAARMGRVGTGLSPLMYTPITLHDLKEFYLKVLILRTDHPRRVGPLDHVQICHFRQKTVHFRQQMSHFQLMTTAIASRRTRANLPLSAIDRTFPPTRPHRPLQNEQDSPRFGPDSRQPHPIFSQLVHSKPVCTR